MDFYSKYFSHLAERTKQVDPAMLQGCVSKLIETARIGGRVYVLGNGGSAAIAAHVAVDLTNAARIPSLTFHDPALMTCFANDYGYEHSIEKILTCFARPEDTTIFISSSGKSPNIINAISKAKELGLFTITFSGFDPSNPLKQIGDINFWVDSHDYNIVELTHNIWLCAIIDMIVSLRNKQENIL